MKEQQTSGIDIVMALVGTKEFINILLGQLKENEKIKNGFGSKEPLVHPVDFRSKRSSRL